MRFTIKNYADFQTAVAKLSEYLSKEESSAEGIFNSKLVVHELIGNALQHAEGGATLKVELVGEHIRIFVREEVGFFPPAGSCPDVFSERGRGIFLVDRVSLQRTMTEEGEILVIIKK